MLNRIVKKYIELNSAKARIGVKILILYLLLQLQLAVLIFQIKCFKSFIIENISHIVYYFVIRKNRKRNKDFYMNFFFKVTILEYFTILNRILRL